MEDQELEQHILDSWDFYQNTLKKSKYFLAPMVDQSELAFRILLRKYGAQVCYSPMMHSRIMLEDNKYYKRYFDNRKGRETQDEPFIVQFCGNDPSVLLQAAQKVEDQCQAVDINFGCPQGIARKGNYGSFLLSQPQLMFKLCYQLKKGLKVPVTCKIRILDDFNKTMEICEGLQKHGCHLLTVHGRTKEQNKERVGSCNWDVIKKIRERLRIPVVCNGGIQNYEDVQRCLEYTGCVGVMSSEGALENVGIFQQQMVDLDQCCKEYIQIAEQTNEQLGWVKAHMFKMLYQGLQKHTDLRSRLGKAYSWQEFKSIQSELQELRKDQPKESKFGWYWRYQKANLKNNHILMMQQNIDQSPNQNQKQKVDDQQQNQQIQDQQQNQKIEDQQQNQKIDDQQQKKIKV